MSDQYNISDRTSDNEDQNFLQNNNNNRDSVMNFHRILTKPLLQNRHRCTASKSSSTTHTRAIVGSSLRVEGGRNAFRLHPTHVRTHGVDKINVVTEQRAERIVSLDQDRSDQDILQLCPLSQTAIVISCKGTCIPHAGQISFN